MVDVSTVVSTSTNDCPKRPVFVELYVKLCSLTHYTNYIRLFRYYLRHGGYVIVVVCLSVVCLFVCLLATLRKNF